MELLEQIRNRLESLQQLSSIVSTMKALSAASIHQYEEAVTSLREYNRTVELGLRVVLKGMEELPQATPRRGEPERLAAIVFGSDHGLCGRFNEEIARHAMQRMEATGIEKSDRLILAVGSRMVSSLEHQDQAIVSELHLPGSASGITLLVQDILLLIDRWREEEGIRNVYLFYNRHTGQRSYQPFGMRLLPINLKSFLHLQENAWPSRSLPIYTMKREQLTTSLLRQYFFVTLFRASAESQASEHASRLAAMESAERNLDERIKDEMTIFRRARQDAITSELLDVVSGFEAITGRLR